MANLTPQQEKFCQAIADGMSQSDAYRAAYPKAKNWKPETLHPQASKMMADPKVVTRVAELRDALSEKALWTREMSVQALSNIVLGSQARPGEIVAAVKELNSMHGYEAPKKSDLRVSGGLVVVPAKHEQ